jgi:hypothetical protein
MKGFITQFSAYMIKCSPEYEKCAMDRHLCKMTSLRRVMISGSGD